MEISRETFTNILEEFAQSGMLFSNERQFQLELAWKLKEKGYTVYLEVLDCSKDKKYIDIVIEPEDGQFVAVELKYTTSQKNMQYIVGEKSVPTFAQGAGDVRRYDYLRDVQRIEELLRNKTGFLGIPNAKVVKGYAIIMTNDKYWDKDGQGTKYEKVALCNGRILSSKEELKLEVKGYENRPPIRLQGEYTCQWEPYILSRTQVIYGADKRAEYSKYEFQYMILEIK